MPTPCISVEYVGRLPVRPRQGRQRIQPSPAPSSAGHHHPGRPPRKATASARPRRRPPTPTALRCSASAAAASPARRRSERRPRSTARPPRFAPVTFTFAGTLATITATQTRSWPSGTPRSDHAVTLRRQGCRGQQASPCTAWHRTPRHTSPSSPIDTSTRTTAAGDVLRSTSVGARPAATLGSTTSPSSSGTIKSNAITVYCSDVAGQLHRRLRPPRGRRWQHHPHGRRPRRNGQPARRRRQRRRAHRQLRRHQPGCCRDLNGNGATVDTYLAPFNFGTVTALVTVDGHHRPQVGVDQRRRPGRSSRRSARPPRRSASRLQAARGARRPRSPRSASSSPGGSPPVLPTLARPSASSSRRRTPTASGRPLSGSPRVSRTPRATPTSAGRAPVPCGCRSGVASATPARPRLSRAAGSNSVESGGAPSGVSHR